MGSPFDHARPVQKPCGTPMSTGEPRAPEVWKDTQGTVDLEHLAYPSDVPPVPTADAKERRHHLGAALGERVMSRCLARAPPLGRVPGIYKPALREMAQAILGATKRPEEHRTTPGRRLRLVFERVTFGEGFEMRARLAKASGDSATGDLARLARVRGLLAKESLQAFTNSFSGHCHRERRRLDG
jgi:hypothetical protein